MKIALVSKEFPPSRISYGIGTYVAETASYLASAGHSVTVICASDDTGRSDVSTGLLRVIRLPDDESFAAGGKLKRLLSFSEAAAIRYRTRVADALDAVIDQGEVEIVEFPGYRGESYVWAKRRRRIPMVARMHGYTGWVQKFWKDHVLPARRFQMRFETEELLSADLVTSVSRQLRRELLRRLPDDRVETLHNGIDSALWAHRGEQPTTIAVGQDIVFVGSLTGLKGVPDLINAADWLHREHGWTGRLLLIGRSSSGFEALMKGRWKHLAGNNSWLKVLGHQNRELLGSIYAAAGVCCFPSREEPFGFTALEALASGGVVVGTEGTGMAEMIVDGVTGYLAPRERPETLASILKIALNASTANRKQMRMAAQSSILSQFDISVIGTNMLAIFGALIQKRQAESPV